MKTNWLVIIACLALSGCATAGIKGTFSDTVVKIEPVDNNGLLAWIFGSKLPSGEYKAVKGDMSLEVKTSKDFKLLDLNMSKVN